VIGMSQVQSKIRNLESTGKRFYALALLFGALAVVMVIAWSIQIQTGLAVTGLNRPVYWGLYISNAIFLAATAAAGIAVSAAIRLLNLRDYAPLGRMGEFLTVACLVAAPLNILFDVGQPLRALINIPLYGRWSSPFVWDFMIPYTYFVATVAYLYLSLRPDLHALPERVRGIRALVYSPFRIGYVDSDAVAYAHQRALKHLTIALIPILVVFHSVLGLIFGLQVSVGGWYSPLMAPSFIVGAVANGIAIIVIIAAVLRKAYGWFELIPDKLITGAAKVMGVFLVGYLYLMSSEILTSLYQGAEAERRVYQTLLFGQYAFFYWPPILLGLILPMLIVVLRGLAGKLSARMAVIAASLTIVGLWAKRVIIVVPPLTLARLPYPAGFYWPTWVEWALIIGTYAVAGLAYLALLKLFPILEIHEGKSLSRTYRPPKGKALLATAAGIMLAGLGATLMLMSTKFAAGVRTTVELPGGPIVLLLGVTVVLLSPVIYAVEAGRHVRREHSA